MACVCPCHTAAHILERFLHMFIMCRWPFFFLNCWTASSALPVLSGCSRSLRAFVMRQQRVHLQQWGFPLRGEVGGWVCVCWSEVGWGGAGGGGGISQCISQHSDSWPTLSDDVTVPSVEEDKCSSSVSHTSMHVITHTVSLSKPSLTLTVSVYCKKVHSHTCCSSPNLFCEH